MDKKSLFNIQINNDEIKILKCDWFKNLKFKTMANKISIIAIPKEVIELNKYLKNLKTPNNIMSNFTQNILSINLDSSRR